MDADQPLTPEARRALAWAPFRSIPAEHRLGAIVVKSGALGASGGPADYASRLPVQGGWSVVNSRSPWNDHMSAILEQALRQLEERQ